jgi:hypothetical protein
VGVKRWFVLILADAGSFGLGFAAIAWTLNSGFSWALALVPVLVVFTPWFCWRYRPWRRDTGRWSRLLNVVLAVAMVAGGLSAVVIAAGANAYAVAYPIGIGLSGGAYRLALGDWWLPPPAVVSKLPFHS